MPAAKLVGPTGRVIAIEPQSLLQTVLRRNFALNDCQVEILSLAVTDHAGVEQIHLTPDTNNASTGLATHTRYDLPSQSVNVTTLSKLFARLGLADSVVMKMDIEGFEHEAILGSPALFINHRIRSSLPELHEPYIKLRGLDPQTVPRFLYSCGYNYLPGSQGHVWTCENP